MKKVQKVIYSLPCIAPWIFSSISIKTKNLIYHFCQKILKMFLLHEKKREHNETSVLQSLESLRNTTNNK